jgi:hypothetical protein
LVRLLVGSCRRAAGWGGGILAWVVGVCQDLFPTVGFGEGFGCGGSHTGCRP